jgi:hypothetical protein
MIHKDEIGASRSRESQDVVGVGSFTRRADVAMSVPRSLLHFFLPEVMTPITHSRLGFGIVLRQCMFDADGIAYRTRQAQMSGQRRRRFHSQRTIPECR